MKDATDCMSTYKSKKQKNIIADIIAIVLLGVWAFFINRHIRVSGLYMDDLYNWSCFKDMSFKDFVLPAGSTRFRPVYWLASWVELCVIGNRLWLIVPINIIILIITAVVCYFYVSDLTESRLIAFFSAFAIVTSRFSYYDVSQLLGLLESLSMIFVIFICIELYKFMYDAKGVRFYIALILYILVCFTHERYIVLLPMFFYVLIMTKDKRIPRYILTTVSFIAVLAVRYHYIGTLLPAGTGGTDVADTFTVSSFIDSVITEFRYLAGFNAGPEYLCGIPWETVDFRIQILVYTGLVLMGFILLWFIITVIKNSSSGRSAGHPFRDVVFYLGFIIGCVVSSSVTIRVEMRWIYSGFVMLVFLIACMYGYIRKTSKDTPVVLAAVIIVLMLLFSIEDIYYRRSWNNIYLFPNQQRYNSLSDTTWGKYREGIFDKNIYIIGNSFEMSDFTADTFFRTFDTEGRADNIKVIHVETAEEIPSEAWGKDIILQEDPANDTFIEIGNP